MYKFYLIRLLSDNNANSIMLDFDSKKHFRFTVSFYIFQECVFRNLNSSNKSNYWINKRMKIMIDI
jgi:hypothetical protein